MAPRIGNEQVVTRTPRSERSEAPPTDAGYRYEVTAKSPSADELKELAKTNKPLADTIKRAQAAFGSFVDREVNGTKGKIVVSTSPGNGGSPVVTVVPPGFDPAKGAKVQTHYHGDRTSAAEPNGLGTQAMQQMMTSDPQQVFVLPEAKGNVGTDGTDWTNVSDQATTTRDALKDAGVDKVASKTVSAHSAGGRALSYALKEGNVDADRVLLLDCLYEPAASNIRKGLEKHGGGVKEIVVALGTNDPDRAEAMTRAFPGKARKVVVPPLNGNHAHNAVLRYLLGGQRLDQAGGGAAAPRAVDRFE